MVTSFIKDVRKSQSVAVGGITRLRDGIVFYSNIVAVFDKTFRIVFVLCALQLRT